MVRLCSVVCVLALIASCGGDDDESSQTTPPPETTSGDETTQQATPNPEDDWVEDEPLDEPVVQHHAGAMEQLTVSPPETPWATMSRSDREMYMIGKVMPVMNEIFARQYGTRVANFGCETCHGRDMREVAFAMPSRTSMPVPPAGTPAYARLERQFPESVRFMRDVVTPSMGTLLGIEGYTCNHCHPGGR